MGLFGALFAGVSGLASQSNKIGIISNNISNVNTVGFKQGQASFNTLVVPSGSTSFSPGGVIGNTQQLISQQGLIQATSSATDIAISGGGLFVVNTEADGSGSTLFTRSGSFTQDANGNFKNANGYFLQGVPVTIPATTLGTSALRTVAVSQGATGTATPTSVISIAATLNASQTALLGSGVNATLSGDTANAANTSTSIIIPTGSLGNNLKRGDTFSITPGTSPADTFTYAGISFGRKVTDATSAGDGDGTITQRTQTSAVVDTTASSGVVVIHVAHLEDFQSMINEQVTIANVVAPGSSSITAGQINGQRTLLTVSGASGAGTITIQSAGTEGGTARTGGSGDISNRTYAFTGIILNASTAAADFLAGIPNPSTVFGANAMQFNITTATGGKVTFTYNASPDASLGQFNSLNTLAATINQASNSTLTARVGSDGRLYVSAADANDAVTFTSGNATGSGGLPGIDWVQELDLPKTAVAFKNAGSTTAGDNFFNSLAGLADKINSSDSANLTARLNTSSSTPTLAINVNDPQNTIVFGDTTITNVGGSIVKELGFEGTGGSAPVAGSGNLFSVTLPALYSASSSSKDMSSGAVTAQFTKPITVYDALGNAHIINLNLSKIGVNVWAAELTANTPSDVISSTSDGQVANGILRFNGNGTLASVTGTIGAVIPVPGTVATPAPFSISWNPVTVGASASSITVNLSPTSTSNGLIQQSTSTGGSSTAAAATIANLAVNGSAIGQLTGVIISAEGFVIATFSNGQTQQLFQVPLASVDNPNGLQTISGNAFQETLASGAITLNGAGQGGTGTLTPSALEQSNVDLSTQLTNLIVAQQAFGANSKVLTIADQLLQQLDQIIQ